MKRLVVTRYLLPAAVGAGFPRRAHVVIAACLAIAMESAIARAESESVCNTYADDAVRAQKFNLERPGCGLTGERWSLDRAAHYDWCRKSEPWRVALEHERRMGELTSCSRPDHCEAYANRAVRQMYIAADRKCGVSGPKFSYDWHDHYNWCASTQPWQHDIEDRARAHALAQCTKAWCETYADRARMQAIENKDLGCGFSGVRWTADWDVHHRWCLASKEKNPDGPGREWQARNHEMNRCKAEKAPARPPRPPKAGLLETNPTDESRSPSGVGTPKPSTPSRSAPPPFIVR
jgi:hypothetical protein